jgi:hypothetical protein
MPWLRPDAERQGDLVLVVLDPDEVQAGIVRDVCEAHDVLFLLPVGREADAEFDPRGHGASSVHPPPHPDLTVRP